MSGEKDAYVNLRQSEYNRMMGACRRLDSVESSVSASVSQMAGSLRSELDSRMSAINRRHASFEDSLSGMSHEVRRIEADMNRQIREQARAFQQGIASVGREIVEQRREYLHLIHEQSQRFDQALQAQRRELQGQIQSIQSALLQKQMSQRQQAEQWVNDTQQLMDMVGKQYRHEKFKPSALERIRGEMALSQGNVSQGNYEAAIASAQQSYLRVSELRMELERLEMEWEAHLEAAKQSAAEVLATCDALPVYL